MNKYIKTNVKIGFLLLLALLAITANSQQTLKEIRWQTQNINFALPPLWNGTAPKRDESLFLSAPSLASFIIVEARPTTTSTNDLNNEFNKPLRINQSLTFWPLGKPTENGNRYSIDFVGHDGHKKLFHRITALTKDKQRFIFAATSPWEHRNDLEKALHDIIDSALNSETKTIAISQTTNQWQTFLPEKVISQIRSEGGFFEEESFHLCGDQFLYQKTIDHNKGNEKPTASGKWQIQNNELILNWIDNSITRFSLSIDNKQFRMNNSVWSIQKSTDCRSYQQP